MTPTVHAPTLADPVSQAPRSAGERALDHFLAAGFERTEPPILHPAAIFLDMSGEEIRRRLFLTADASGEELCLRPEYTIPVCRAYLASDRAGGIAEYSYLGPVFRARAGQDGEQTQTGLESFGRKDAEAADAEIFALRLEAATAAGGGALAARLGDAGLFDSAARNRSRFPTSGAGACAAASPAGAASTPSSAGRGQSAPAQPGVLAALESADHAGAKALVEDLLAIAGIDAVGGRSAGEIADRFLEQASLRSGEPIEAEKRAVLEAFLAISGDPDEAAIELRRLADSAGLDLAAALDAFELRNGFIAARGAPIEAIRFSAAFVRDFDYYTGFVFEAHDAATLRAKTALAGGRYDGLARRLGAAEDIPAVGAAITLDRLRERERALMGAHPGNGAEAPFVLAVPSKGRLQEAAAAFFARAGLELMQGRGARDYRGAIAGLPGVEVAYVSSAEIVGQLAAGAAHFGVAGEDLVREKVADVDARLELLSPLGFGHANVVVAAPQAWIDVRSMADLEDVASAYRARRGERMRVATKYVNLTRRFFAEHGVADYRIVESLGATEGAPAVGRGRAHRRHHHDRRDARGQRAENARRRRDPALAGDAGRFARPRPGARSARQAARDILARIAASEEAATSREVRARLPSPAHLVVEAACERFGAVSASGEDVDPHGFVALHCARGKVADLAGWLLDERRRARQRRRARTGVRRPQRALRGAGEADRAGAGRSLDFQNINLL